MRGAVRRQGLVIALGLSVLPGGCEREARTPPAEVSVVAPSPGMGTWEWVQSTGGALGDTLTPGVSGRSYRLELLPGGRFRETSSAQGVTEGSFTSTAGEAFEAREVASAILRFDPPLFNGGFIPSDEYAMVIRGDTLELDDRTSHAWVHRYLRAPRNPKGR